jgi:hypothetical protein
MKGRITVTATDRFDHAELELLLALCTLIWDLDYGIETDDGSVFAEEAADYADWQGKPLNLEDVEDLAKEDVVGLVSYRDELFPAFEDVPEKKKILLKNRSELLAFIKAGRSYLS